MKTVSNLINRVLEGEDVKSVISSLSLNEEPKEEFKKAIDTYNSQMEEVHDLASTFIRKSVGSPNETDVTLMKKVVSLLMVIEKELKKEVEK